MEYDLFISYAAEDVAWARKLESDLTAGRRTVFRDETRLEVGRRWEVQLRDALDASQHLVVIWSPNAKASDWVHKEMGRFERNTETDAKRRLICINLEGRNVAYETYQNIDLNFSGDAATLDPNRWNDVLTRLRTAIDEDEGVDRIETVVLAMTDAEAAASLSQQQLEALRTEFGLNEADVRARYRSNRLDWRPYGDERTIKTLLDERVEDLNGAVAAVAPGARFAWKPISNDFWLLDGDRPQQVAAGLANAKLSLVVIDALSLQSPGIYRQSMLLREHLKGRGSTWIFLPPLPSDRTVVRYRELVQQWSRPLLDVYFNPPLFGRDQLLPRFGVFCGDRAEIRRLVLDAAGEYLARNEKVLRSRYTDYRGGAGH